MLLQLKVIFMTYSYKQMKKQILYKKISMSTSVARFDVRQHLNLKNAPRSL